MLNRTVHTVVHKFTVDANAAAAQYNASGKVPGAILNQFSMDQHAEHLRIATTETAQSTACTINTNNHLFILAEGQLPEAAASAACEEVENQEGCHRGLLQTGAIRDIAKGESIHSVRFDGDRGFMVTFQVIDPLSELEMEMDKQKNRVRLISD